MCSSMRKLCSDNLSESSCREVVVLLEVHGLLYVKINGVIYVPWYDAYGNVMGYWDAQGNVVAEYTYNAFGKLIASLGPMADVFSLRYFTKYFDPETGFYYYGYRFYSPFLKRWLTRDPIGENGGINLYAMCENDPVSSFDGLGLARMLTGALNTRAGRLPYPGELYARNILRLVHEFNSKTDSCGNRLFYAEIRDLVFTSETELREKISTHPDDVYIIAHGGIKKNGRIVSGTYEWEWRDKAIEGIVPNGPRGGRFISLSSLGPGLNYDNIFGCYISKRVRKIDGVSKPEDYSELYLGLYRRLLRYRNKKMRNKCPKSILIYEGENSGSNESTAYMLNHYPLKDESYYKNWLKSEAQQISSGGIK